MSENQYNVNPVSNEEGRKFILDVTDKMAEVLWFFFQDSQEENGETDEDFIGLMWDLAILSLGATGLKIIGKTPDGRMIVEMTPINSVKDLLKEKSVGQEDMPYFETEYDGRPSVVSPDVEYGDNGEIIGLGEWDGYFTK